MKFGVSILVTVTQLSKRKDSNSRLSEKLLHRSDVNVCSTEREKARSHEGEPCSF